MSEKEKPERCHVCKKKAHLLVDCACGQHFCISHRHHECEVKRQQHLNELKNSLPVVTPCKLEKI